MRMFNFKITNDQNDEFEFEMYRKQLVAKVLLIFGLPTVSYFMIRDFIIGRYDIAFFLLFMFLVLIALFFVLRSSFEQNQKYKISQISLTLFVILFGIYLIYSIGVAGMFIRIPWAYIFPLLVFLVLGLTEGLLWLFILFCGLASSMFYFDFHPISLEELRARFLISFSLISIMSFLFAYLVRSDHRKLLNNQHVLKNEIKQREHAEEALRESERKYRELADFLPEMVYECDENGKILFANRCAFETFGYTQEDFDKGLSIFQMIIPENREEVNENFKMLLKGKNVIGHEYTALRKDGTTLPALVSANLIIHDSKPVGIRGIAINITERKRVEEALRESEEKYRLLVENAAEAIFVAQDGMLKFANHKATEMIGYSKEDLTPRPFMEFIHSDDREMVLERHLKRIRGEALPGVYSFRIVDKGGEIKWVEINAVLISWEGRSATLNFLVDIDERKRTEEMLRESEEKYRTILENIEDAYYEVDLAGNFTFFNDSLCRMLGYSKDELMGMDDRRYTDREDAKKLYQAFNKVYRTGEPAKAFNWEVISKDGTRRIGEASISLIKDSEGQPCGFRGIARDISERKQAEESLRTERQRFQTLIENAPFGMVMIDRKGTFQYINPKYIALFGYDLKDVPDGITWFRKAYPDPTYRQNVISTWKSDLETSGSGESRPRTFKVNCKDGTEKIINFIPVQLEAGENLMACEDITDLKRAEEEMVALQEQLRQSQKMEAIGRLAGGIAHDFNNLLTIIKGYSQLSLLELKEGDVLRGNIEEIQKASERAANLTGQLLAFSRRQVLETKVINLNSLMKDLGKMLRRVIGEDIELVTLLGEDLGKVNMDPGQMEQVIMNLAVNARDAMPSGGKLTIETVNVQLDEAYARSHLGAIPGHYVLFSMSDTGGGMSPEIKEHIFEPFFTTKEKGKGTGLGLSMVYGIVKQSGANILVYSEPGQGTTFKIYFPQVQEEESTLRRRDDTGSLPQGWETVLLVEDEEGVRTFARKILQSYGYRILEAANGEEALRVAQEHLEEIHLLLTDVVMPQVGGKELADRLKPSRPSVKVLFISGFPDDAIAHHGILAPGIAFLQKPFSPSALAQKVREVLDR